MSINGNAEQVKELRGELSIPEAIRGKSAYELAVMCGFEGTLEEWLDSLKLKYGDLTDEEIAALVADVTDNLSAIVVQIKEELVASVEQNAKVAANAKQDAEAAKNEASHYAEAAYNEAERAKTYKDETEQKRNEVIFYAQGAYNDSTAAAASVKRAEAAEAEAKNHRDTALLHKNAANLSETNAKTSEDNAKTSENNAAKSATKAEDSAKNIEAHEQNSSASATEAKNAETEAKKAAEDAESAKNEAVENASIATDKAQLATDKASEAAESANNAERSEKTATDKAKEAGESANAATEAKEAAEKARDDAETAKGFAEDAATKAEDAADRAENATEFLKNGALFANAIRGRLFGASVSAEDVSLIEHELEVRVTSKNLMNTSCTYGTLIAVSGGVATSTTASAVSDFIYLSKGDYFVSYKNTVDLRGVAFYKEKNEASFIKYVWVGRPNTFSYKFTVDEPCFVRMDIEKDGFVAIDNIDTFFADNEIQLEKGIAKTDYEPFFDTAGTQVNLFGKNLSQIYAADLKGTAITENIPVLYEGCLPDGAVLSWKKDFTVTNDNAAFRIVDTVTNAENAISPSGNSAIILPQENKVRIDIPNTGNHKGKITEIQLELGSAATAFVKYIQPSSVAVDAEGNAHGLISLYPIITLVADDARVIVECEYNRDTNKVVTDLEAKLNTLIATIGG